MPSRAIVHLTRGLVHAAVQVITQHRFFELHAKETESERRAVSVSTFKQPREEKLAFRARERTRPNAITRDKRAQRAPSHAPEDSTVAQTSTVASLSTPWLLFSTIPTRDRVQPCLGV
jgi:hypothetical protein